ncbi:Nitroreductase-like protein [Roridomyces roridus]|uniref:Nitroreductase-like protein n=1 Tax=Roridomyces roridus TaxID=1738132 RepID=A0AAD7B2C3_9AGAR|nr:Nitroreductase-like protein [Roridomyces roridus]
MSTRLHVIIFLPIADCGVQIDITSQQLLDELTPSNMSASYLEAITVRRSNYALTSKSSVSDEKLQDIIKHTVKHCPSPFNSQASRVILVTGATHIKLWEAVIAALLPRMPEGEIRTRFAGGYGSVMFFEDQAILDEMIKKQPFVANQFPDWNKNAAGILHATIWTAFSLEGLAATLQHPPLTAEMIAGLDFGFDVPSTWKSTAILPFGDPAAAPKEKTFLPVEDRFKVVKS